MIDLGFDVGEQIQEIRIPVELHVFFVRLEETEEMLAALRRADAEIIVEQIARSKVGQTNLVIRPIDATAARVCEARKST